VQKNFDNGLFASVAYNYLISKDVNSIEAEITGDAFAFNPALGNVNDAKLSNSKYGDTHRFIGVASKKWNMVMTNGPLLFLHSSSTHKEVVLTTFMGILITMALVLMI
jgi:hypothetical protein